jgi:putative transposase
MPPRKIYDTEGHAQFVTFSCYKRRRLLDPDVCKRIVIGTLGSQLAKQQGVCIGFVIMPNHVHALVWFHETEQLSNFDQVWKQRTSVQIKQQYAGCLAKYAKTIDSTDPEWTPKYYPFNVFSETKVFEKLQYMHEDPVRAGLVARPVDWPWSSARWYEDGRSVGVPIGWVG